jgi:sugar-specific transcriptional regulator TrmB
MLEKDLESFGLTTGEAKAYLALMTLGPSTVGPIAKKSSISYSKIYEVLQRLIEKGLVSSTTKEKTRHYQAVPPSRIIEFLGSSPILGKPLE